MKKYVKYEILEFAGPDGDVLVTYRGDQIQNTPVVLEFWPPQEKTIQADNIVEHTFAHKTCQCPDDPCCHVDPAAGCNKSPDGSWSRGMWQPV